MTALPDFQRIVVTGGAGFVGSNLVRALQDARPDARLLVIDDFRSGTFANLSDEFPRPGADDAGWSYRGELIARPLHELDLAELFAAFEPDVVFHEASITETTVDDQALMIEHNVRPFEALLQEQDSRGFPLVWVSSAATYGTAANGATEAKRPFTLEDAGSPANVYGFSKWLMENLHRRALGVDPARHLVGLRYFNVFGPGEAHKGHMASMVYRLARQMLDGQRPRVFHGGEQARDQVYVDDVVDATLAAAASGATPGIYNVGSGEATSFNAIIAALNDALATDLPPEYFDNPYTFYQGYTCADLSATREGLGWSPGHAPADAIRTYARWLRGRREAGHPS